MTRGMTSTMETEAQAAFNQPVFFVRLDIATDPFIKWTGYGDFTPVGTGDTAFDGFTFNGMGNIGEIGAVRDTDKGSSNTKLELPGVDINDTVLKEIIQDMRQWQYRRAWIWAGYLDADLAVVADPTRIKTGRMDTLEINRAKGIGSVVVNVESHQANISQSQANRMSDQKNLDPTDTSMDFIYDLVNRVGGAGEPTVFARGEDIGVIARSNGSGITGNRRARGAIR